MRNAPAAPTRPARLARCLIPALVCLVSLAAGPAHAEVTRVQVTTRADVAGYDYERITGRVYFSVDPGNPRNAVIADLDKAPRTPAGRVEFSADFSMLKPKSGGTGVALLDVVNRGRRTGGFSRSGGDPDPYVGDGFLLRRGLTIVGVGWEFDVPAANGLLTIEAPIATDAGTPITGIVRATFALDRPDEKFVVGDLAGYQPVEPGGPDTTLTVRDLLWSRAQDVPRTRWQLAGNQVTLTGGFEPGRTYELAYRARNPRVGGVGFLAVRDVAAWLKHGADPLARAQQVVAFGSSQCGRFLRSFLYEGFNADEGGRQVFDGVIAHIAGSARIDLNHRWSTPTAVATYAATAFPFSDSAQLDPVSGATEGTLDNLRARATAPKIFYTNTSVEYWGGGRVAALLHSTPDGMKDVALADNVRTYFLAGAQHGPAPFPPHAGMGQQLPNPNDYWWSMRALLVAMERWVRDGAAPPPSQYPHVADGTLVPVLKVAFPVLAGVQSPLTLVAGPRVANQTMKGGAGAGATLPLMVPQVDADGNERAGIRLPEVAVPLATHTGWNFRGRTAGGANQLVALTGSYVPFPRTKGERERRGDPRRSIDERYAGRDQYLAEIRSVAAALTKAGYLLDDDVAAMVTRAAAHWDAATSASGLSRATP